MADTEIISLKVYQELLRILEFLSQKETYSRDYSVDIGRESVQRFFGHL